MSVRQMRDLDKIQERGSLRLSTRQAGALTFGVLLLVSLSFVVGLQAGRVLTPDADDLVAPDVASADRSIAEILETYQERDAAAAEAPTSTPADADAAADTADETTDAPAADESPEPVTEDPSDPTPPADAEGPTSGGGAAFELVWEDDRPTPGRTDPATDGGEDGGTDGAADVGTDGGGRTDGAAETDAGVPSGDPFAHLPSPGREGTFSVQLAAFSTVGEADSLIAALRIGGIEAYKMEAVVRSQTWYRVRVGHFRTRGDAERWLPVVGPFSGFEPMVMRD